MRADNGVMLTIGEVATRAGVTVRAVRHYHAKGLLAEPGRDRSGYRRYDAGAVVELIRIRTLAAAGVPLARVRELLSADEDEFETAIAEIDARLRAEIGQREQFRRDIARLGAGDNLALPAVVVEFLDHLRALGVDERIIQVERDGWIPLSAHSPARVEELIARKQLQITDQPLLDFYRTLGHTLDTRDDEAALVDLVDKMAEYLTQLADAHGDGYIGTDLEPTLTEFLDHLACEAVPDVRRLIELLAARGWSGWTDLQRRAQGT